MNKEITKFIRFKRNDLPGADTSIIVKNILSSFEAYVKEYGSDPSHISAFSTDVPEDNEQKLMIVLY